MKISRHGRWVSPLALILCLSAAGCDDVTNLVQAPAHAPAPRPSHVAANGPVRLHPGDKVRVTVIGEEKISGEFEIDTAGDISIPAAGTLHVAGLTKAEVEARIVGKLKGQQYLLNPMVTVDVSSFRPFYVLGEVAKPGEYPYHSGLNILSAVAVAGGDTYRANQSHALVQRAGEDGFHEYPLSPDVPIYPGDLIKIPERYF